LTTDG
jgi:hypothetical protein